MIAYRPYRRRGTGQVREIQELPTSAIFNAAMGYGREFLQAQNAVQRMVEMGVAEGRVLSPDEANELYSMPGLEFNEPVIEGQARLMRQRKELENARMFYLQNAKGATGVAASFAGQVIGSQMSLTDFGLNFLPIIGQEKYTRLAGIASKARTGATSVRIGGGLGRPVVRASKSPFIAQRYRMAGGLVSEGRSTAAQILGSAVDAAAGNLIAEIPIFMANTQQQAEYGISDVVIGTAVGAGLGGGLRAAAIGLSRLSSGTKKEMAVNAHDEFLRDKDIEAPARLAALDRNAIEIEIRNDEGRRMRDAAEIRRQAKEAVSEQEADIQAAVGAKGKWIEDIARKQEDEARAGAKEYAESRRAKVKARVKAKLEELGTLGRVSADQAVQIGDLAVSRAPKSSRGKIAARLVERAKGGDKAAVDELARLFFLELDEGAREIPALFSKGEVDPKLTPGQLKAVDEIIDVLPENAAELMRSLSTERLDVELRAERGTQAKLDRMERAELRRRLNAARGQGDAAAAKKRRVEKERVKRYKAEVRRLTAENESRIEQLVEDTFQQRVKETLDKYGFSKNEAGNEPVPKDKNGGEGLDTSFYEKDASELEARLKEGGEFTALEQEILDGSFDYDAEGIKAGMECMALG